MRDLALLCKEIPAHARMSQESLFVRLVKTDQGDKFEETLRRRLQATKEVADLIAALADGALSEEKIRSFISSLMKDLRPREAFPHDLVLAALAIVLESQASEFAQEYQHDLAGLELAEMSTSIRIAKQCVLQRQRFHSLNHLPKVDLASPSSQAAEATRNAPVVSLG